MPHTLINVRARGRMTAIWLLVVVLGAVLLEPAAALAAGSSTGSGGGGDFVGIARGLGDQGAQIAKIIGALLLIGTIFLGWVQNNLKIVGIGIVMAIIASFAVSGQLWKAGQGTANSISGGSSGSGGQVQGRP